MNRPASLPETVVLQVPFRIVKRGGRKDMVIPASTTNKRATPNGTLVKALARAFRWKRMLETGKFITVSDLADSEKIAASYVTRVLRLTLLAPAIVEAILEGRLEHRVELADLLEAFPVEWSAQPQELKACVDGRSSGPSTC